MNKKVKWINIKGYESGVKNFEFDCYLGAYPFESN